MNTDDTPKGKRSIRLNIWGNWVGYVSGRRWMEFGCQAWAEREAREWLEHQPPQRNYSLPKAK